jgi:hypothetical protein
MKSATLNIALTTYLEAFKVSTKAHGVISQNITNEITNYSIRSILHALFRYIKCINNQYMHFNFLCCSFIPNMFTNMCRPIREMKTNLMQYLPSVYFVSQLLHASGIFLAHHQEVYCIYTANGTCCCIYTV